MAGWQDNYLNGHLFNSIKGDYSFRLFKVWQEFSLFNFIENARPCLKFSLMSDFHFKVVSLYI